MVFEKIANGLTKHYKMVIVVWIVALLLAVPAILQVNSAVQYQSGFSSGGDYESTRAQEMIDRNFQTSVANGTLIILLQDDNITDASSRDFVLALQERIESSSDLKYLHGASSIYSYSGTVMDQAILQL
jgi:RND superfamily putative drug exporter